jgi:hypothetical protein
MDEQLNQDQQQQQQEAAATSGEGVALDADTTSASDTQSSVANASQGDDTAASQSSGAAGEVGNAPAAGATEPVASSNTANFDGAAADTGNTDDAPQSEGDAPQYETKMYTDGTTASGIAPLPDLSPAEQDAAGNASTLGASTGSGAESPNGRHPAHRWIDLAELKLAAIEHAAVAELLDIMRNLRQEL